MGIMEEEWNQPEQFIRDHNSISISIHNFKNIR